MNLVTLIPSGGRSVLGAPFNKRGFSPTGNSSRGGRTAQASRTFFNPSTKASAFKVVVKKGSKYQGKAGNSIFLVVWYQTGNRYFFRFFDRTGTALGGLISTAGIAEGATTSAGIVAKGNAVAVYKDDFEFVLIENVTGVDYGDSATTFAAASPLRGGRG
jgi:hypothetical protein